MATEPDGEALPATTGRGSGLFERKDNLRSDARMIAKMLTLGVVTVEEVEDLLRKAFSLANGADNARDFAAMMKVIIASAKLEQDERKLAEPDQSAVTVNIQNNGGNVPLNERRADLVGIIGAALDRQREAASSGTIDATADAEPAVPITPAD